MNRRTENLCVSVAFFNGTGMNGKGQITPQRKVIKMFEPWKTYGSESNGGPTLWRRTARPTTGASLMAPPTSRYLSTCEPSSFERPVTAPVRCESYGQNSLVQALIHNIDKFITQDNEGKTLRSSQDDARKTKETKPFYKIKKEYVAWNSSTLDSSKETKDPEDDNKKHKVLSKFNELKIGKHMSSPVQHNRLSKTPFTLSDSPISSSNSLKPISQTVVKNHGDCKLATATVPAIKSSRQLCRHCRLRYIVESSEVDDDTETLTRNSLRKRYRKAHEKLQRERSDAMANAVETPHLARPKSSTAKRTKSVSSKCSDSSSYKTTVSTASKTRLLQEFGSASEFEWTGSEIDLMHTDSMALPRETRRATIVMMNSRKKPTKTKQSHVDIIEDKDCIIKEIRQTIIAPDRICRNNLLCTKLKCQCRRRKNAVIGEDINSKNKTPSSLDLFKNANSIHPYCAVMLNAKNYSIMDRDFSGTIGNEKK